MERVNQGVWETWESKQPHVFRNVKPGVADDFKTVLQKVPVGFWIIRSNAATLRDMQEGDLPQDDYRKAFLRCKRALEHLMHKKHKLRPVSCDGCKEVALFLTEPGYRGDDKNPVGVDY